ncbi:HD domain-containing protein, partial [Litorivicinus sp.]|nr:HD domain-containing protein [Litorivicinus sp.]
MDWNHLLSTARVDHQQSWTPQSSKDERSQWQRDHDRLIFSGAFRRLAVKTQVHPLSDNDHVHTRLSHSLEVASVGRSLGIRLGNWMRGEGLLSDQHAASSVGALVQAACIAHDIGNPPFGHAGERSIRQFFESYPEY